MFIVTAASDWWARLSRASKLVGFVGIFMGAIVSTAAAWQYIEPWWYSSHSWSRSEIHEPLLSRIVKIQIKQNHDERDQLLKEAKTRELELSSPQVKDAPNYQALVQERVDRIKHRLDEIDKEDANLFKEKAPK